ncbi:hypothetical protein [Halorarum halobium]|uniref:hypothetical protein n=1 Tax=Halorarum halobium TaxID=3075121 RepID=UPI0028AF39F8|nr:hypothetical protein [Halobaculum sp. XH14]
MSERGPGEDDADSVTERVVSGASSEPVLALFVLLLLLLAFSFLAVGLYVVL